MTTSAGRRRPGLRNLGATCYLASLLQVLFNNLAFRSKVNSWPDARSTCVCIFMCVFSAHHRARRVFAGRD